MKHLLTLFSLFFLLTVSFIQAQIPNTINYQGVLTDNAGLVVPDDNYALTFRLYDAVTAGTILWEESRIVPVEKGLFDVILGEVVPINLLFNNQYWLGITISTGSELAPRTKMSSVAYSLNSKSIMDSSITTSKIVDGAVTQAKLDAGVTLPPGGSAGGDLSGTYPNPTVNKLQGRNLSSLTPSIGQVLYWDGSQWMPTTPASGLGGSGTINYLTKFTALNTLGNSAMYEDESGNVLIDATLNAERISVNNEGLYETAINVEGSWSGIRALGSNRGIDAYGNAYGVFAEGNYAGVEARGDYCGATVYGNNIGLLVNGGEYAGYFTSDSLSPQTHVLHSEFTGYGNNDVVAVYGRSVPAENWGIGGEFEGGYMGVLGIAYDGIGVYGHAFGGTTNYAVYASGDLAYTNTLIHIEPLITFKKNINSFSAVNKITQLKPRTFSYTSDNSYSHMNLPSGIHYGLIAQELEKVFPELVVDAIHPSAEETHGKRGGEEIHYKGVKYMELIPILIQAVKEQQTMINELTRRIEQLERR